MKNKSEIVLPRMQTQGEAQPVPSDNHGPELQRAKKSLGNSELRYHELFEASLDGILILDAETGAIADVNSCLLRLLGYSRDELVGKKFWDTNAFPDIDTVRSAFRQLQTEHSTRYNNLRLRSKDGGVVRVEFVASVFWDDNKKFIRSNIRDVTALKNAESALQEFEGKFRRLVEHLPSLVYTNPIDDVSSTLYVSPQILPMLGYTQNEWLVDPKLWSKCLHPEDRLIVLAQAAAASRTGEQFEMEYRMIARDGRVVWMHDKNVLMRDAEGRPQFWEGIMFDVTERKRNEEKFREFIDGAPDAIVIVNRMGIITLVNSQLESIFGYKRDEILDKPIETLIPERFRKEHLFHRYLDNDQLGVTTMGAGLNLLCRRKDESEFPVEIRLSPIGTDEDLLVMAAIRDITQRRKTENRILQQIDLLTALREIDRVISSSFDLNLSLRLLLQHAVTQLSVDAADVLVLNPDFHQLEFSSGIGFHNQAIERAKPRLGASLAGRVILEGQTIHAPNLKKPPDSLLLREELLGENFMSYFGVPLIAKGQTRGVLEIYHRSPLHPDEEWLNYLHTFAGQAMLAIDNVTLFTNLQSSNTELFRAYNATIEGWSHALDLRDKETEGHTQRVTEMTVRLARAYGLNTADLVQVRWGALLHDIGKLAVPDAVLHKPGPLSDEEWELMKRHPFLAYEMISPIHYLHLAVDIPYCHHEKWDGTGYPRGLTRGQIPLAARLFTVVDMWDAITSERPYRPAWSRERALAYIREQSGKHLDPDVCLAFLDFIQKGE